MNSWAVVLPLVRYMKGNTALLMRRSANRLWRDSCWPVILLRRRKGTNDMVASREDMKQHVLALLDTLPDESLFEVAAFLDFQQYKQDKQRASYRPVTLDGLWRGMRIDDEEIADVRREMWDRFATPEP